MYAMDLYRLVRLACQHEGLSRREAAQRFGIDRKIVSKMLAFSVRANLLRLQSAKASLPLDCAGFGRARFFLRGS